MKFSLKPGNLHGVSCAEGVLTGCSGMMIGDNGYISATLQNSLVKKGIRSIANIAPIWSQTPQGKKIP
ncbi:MAG: transposase [Puniceicoccales bacterium]|nr:transposase [Puniceicoccales bacterium]